jgi:hypothetical protein
MNERELAGFPPDVALGDERTNGATQRIIDGARTAAGRGHAFEEVDDEHIGARLGEISGYNCELHFAMFPCRETWYRVWRVYRPLPRGPNVRIAAVLRGVDAFHVSERDSGPW